MYALCMAALRKKSTCHLSCNSTNFLLYLKYSVYRTLETDRYACSCGTYAVLIKKVRLSAFIYLQQTTRACQETARNCTMEYTQKMDWRVLFCTWHWVRTLKMIFLDILALHPAAFWVTWLFASVSWTSLYVPIGHVIQITPCLYWNHKILFQYICDIYMCVYVSLKSF